MIGTPGTDKTHLSIIIGLSASKEGSIVHKQKQFKPKTVKTVDAFVPCCLTYFCIALIECIARDDFLSTCLNHQPPIFNAKKESTC
jgi:hypothetical protein